MSDLYGKILEAQQRPLPTRDVEVPEWGATVRVVALDGDRLAEYLSAEDAHRRHARLVACSCFDGGERLFMLGDVDMLHANPAPMMRLWQVARQLNAWMFEDAEKNSQPPAASPSASV